MQSNEKQEFQVGDIVEAFGVRGVVTSVEAPDCAFPVVVDFSGDGFINQRAFFTGSGRLEYWHRKPALTLIERPRKRKKIKVWAWVGNKTIYGIYPWHTSSALFLTKEAAEEAAAAAAAEEAAAHYATLQEIEVEVDA